jgi:predicted membrane channel-forming protein YqfA (hemolysin III family)
MWEAMRYSLIAALITAAYTTAWLCAVPGPNLFGIALTALVGAALTAAIWLREQRVRRRGRTPPSRTGG